MDLGGGVVMQNRILLNFNHDFNGGSECFTGDGDLLCMDSFYLTLNIQCGLFLKGLDKNT